MKMHLCGVYPIGVANIDMNPVALQTFNLEGISRRGIMRCHGREISHLIDGEI